MRMLEEHEVEDVQAKIDWEGFDDYLVEGDGASDLAGTEAAPLLVAYVDAKHALTQCLREMGLDV